MTLGRPGKMFEDSTLGVGTITLGRPREKTLRSLVLQVSVQLFIRWLLKKVKQFPALDKQLPGLVKQSKIHVMNRGKGGQTTKSSVAGEMFEDSTLGVVTMILGRPGEKTVKSWVLQVSVQAFTRRWLKKVKQFPGPGLVKHSESKIQVLTLGIPVAGVMF